MFVTSSQFYVFIACVCYGCLSGVLLLLNDFIKPLFKWRVVGVIIDVFSFIFISFGYVLFSFKYNFPNFRTYMFLGVLFGLFLSYKSFSLVLAKCHKKIYNIYVKKIRKNSNDTKRI